MIRNILEKLMDIVFPPAPETLVFRSMTAQMFRQKAMPSSEDPRRAVAISVFDYRDPLVRQAIWELKYRGSGKAAELLGLLLYEEIIGHVSEHLLFSRASNLLLIPIPLSAKRKRKRGWNQSELLAKEVCKHDHAGFLTYFPKGLHKKKHTKPQTELKRAERLENLRDCFRVGDADRIRGAHIILIDDVTTTGATLKEARRTLLKAGAKRVKAFTVAH